MSIIRLVQVGTTTLQAVIDAVERFGADPDTLGTRLSVAQLLHFQLDGITADADEEPLLEAYREWLSVAARYYGPPALAAQATQREYARAAAILLAEVRMAETALIAAAAAGTDGRTAGGAGEFTLTSPSRNG
jgi:hypothetical protein